MHIKLGYQTNRLRNYIKLYLKLTVKVNCNLRNSAKFTEQTNTFTDCPDIL